LYTCGQSVVIRNIKNPLIAETYDEHQRAPTVARYSPSGYYIASGDASGTVRIWDTTQATHPLKIELPVLGGAVLDLAWSEDSKRIVVGGDGRDKYGHAFIWDSGASVGEIGGHAKPIYSIDMKPSRPYRVATGSEDMAINFYAGPPFKYQHAMTEHTRFVNCVRFSPNGNTLASVGSDKKIFLYDGKEGTKKGELAGDSPHTGGIYACSWSADSSKLLTSSGDCSAKIWDVESGACVSTFQFPKETNFHQVGCLWQNGYLLTVNLDGHITYLDINNPDKPIQVLKGHNKFVTGLAYDSKTSSIYSASYDSVITKWDINTGETWDFEGQGHKNKIEAAVVQGNNLITGGMDDSILVTPLDSRQYNGDVIATDSPVSCVDASADVAAGVSMNNIYLIRNGRVVQTKPAGYNPKSVAVSPDGSIVAVGGEDNHIYLFDVAGDVLTDKHKLEGHRGGVVSLAFSPDGKWLASGSKDRAVYVWNVNTYELAQSGWKFHSAVVNSVAWSPDSLHVASGSLDQNVFVWDLTNPRARINIKGAHRSGCNKVAWVDNNTVLSAGQDSCLKTWKISF